MTESLGQLERVEVRHLWPHETADFTPWLAREENMSKLGDALGLELEAEGTEVAVGPYSADILALDSAGNYVVLENQLAKTDHDHLGKSIAYAAVLGARTVIWVAPNFTDEHRKAFDWLNDNTTDELSFYAVQVELWSIDSSLPAVRFNVVSRPAEIIRQAAASKSGKLSDSRWLQLEWWTAFREALVASKLVGSTQTPRAQYWYSRSPSRWRYAGKVSSAQAPSRALVTASVWMSFTAGLPARPIYASAVGRCSRPSRISRRTNTSFDVGDSPPSICSIRNRHVEAMKRSPGAVVSGPRTVSPMK